MNQRAWYQDGGVVLFWCIVGAFGWFVFSMFPQVAPQQSLPTIRPQVVAGVTTPLWGDPSFEVTVWHQFPGDLRNGYVGVLVDYERTPEGQRAQAHSFEVFHPNKDQAVTMKFPLPGYDGSQEFRVDVLMKAKEIQDSLISGTWSGSGWKFAEEPPAAPAPVVTPQK